ncbi:Polysaccharide deacetylase [Planctomycetes bacterium Pla163]|uniref:Polysaccharide deacetylase n=1 Tax=Rohdeia mirabilis TaxID=2528008 RepID=A0A518D086_9BACT|nr:Polysaccharide deacetylase [Planctomycetes bacterium Pla163]
MSLKHRLKLGLREGYARLLFHTGLHRVVDRLMPRRMTILFGHCVEDDSVNGFLPRDMTMREETLRRVLSWFGRRGYVLTNVGAGMSALDAGTSGPSLVALSMDDGYKDNRTRLLPVLSELGASATVFLESRPLDERRVNWTHKLHWIVRDGGEEACARAYVERCRVEADRRTALASLEGPGERLLYRFKRVLKYEVDTGERDRVVDELFREAGGDERALCDALYMDWDDARALRDGGVELGGHTVNHVILSRLGPDDARTEIGHCRDRMVAELGPAAGRTFAYPFGRRWDYDQNSMQAARDVGFELAVNTHAGVNRPSDDRLQLRRLPVDDRTPLHLLVAEACGGFELLRRVGLELGE